MHEFLMLTIPSSGGVWFVIKPEGIELELFLLPFLFLDVCWCSSEKSIGWLGSGTIPGSENTALECDMNNSKTIELYTAIFTEKWNAFLVCFKLAPC